MGAIYKLNWKNDGINRNKKCKENGIEGEYMFPPWIQTLNIRSFCLTCGVYINHFSIRLVFVIILKLIKKKKKRICIKLCNCI